MGAGEISAKELPFASRFMELLSGVVSMNHVLIVHEVADYPAWKAIFDGASGIRREAGERSYMVLRDEKVPNRIVHFSKWTSAADARAFFESERLVQIRKEAGVQAPEFNYLTEIESGDL